jgi:hypothetical protein
MSDEQRPNDPIEWDPSQGDPFANLEEELAAWELLNENAELLETLVRDAQEILSRSPDAELAGMILDANAPEAAPLCSAIEEVTGQRIRSGFYGVVPRLMIEQLVRHNAPQLFELWSEGDAAPNGPHLPVLIATGGGFQMGYPKL